MSKREKEYYISLDVEADGPCPLVNSMLQLGAVFYDPEGNMVEEYKANILEIDGAVQDPSTMKWWADQEERFPGIWTRMMENRVDAKTAMDKFAYLVTKYCLKFKCAPLVIAYPAGFDFTYLYVYCCKFLGKSPVGFSALDMKTLAMSLIQDTYHNSAKKRFPQHWFNSKLKHTHDALDDARGQGYTFFKMKKQMELNWITLNAAMSSES